MPLLKRSGNIPALFFHRLEEKKKSLARDFVLLVFFQSNFHFFSVLVIYVCLILMFLPTYNTK